MGCGESRVKRISLTSEQDWEVNDKPTEVATVVNVVKQLSASALQPTVRENDNNEETKLTPSNVWEGLESRAPVHRLLDSIPTSDLGESLDCRGRKMEVELEMGGDRYGHGDEDEDEDYGDDVDGI